MASSIDYNDFEYIENSSTFTCKICLSAVNPGDGIILKSCLHEFCKSCITKVIKFSTEAQVQCPHVSEDNQKCTFFIQDRELRCFITDEDYMRHLEKSLSQAEITSKMSYHCKTPNCVGWVEILNRNLKNFKCATCNKVNCIPCKSIHEKMTCVEFRNLGLTDGQKSNILIKRLIRERKVMKCPKCGILVEKTRGCNHMKCLKCNQEFQWIGKSGFEWVR